MNGLKELDEPARRRRAGGLPAALAAVSFGVLRPQDSGEIYAYPGPEFVRLEERGALHRLAHGYYAVVPPAAQTRPWLPSLEASAYGIAAATSGADEVVLMGVSAARVHGVIPRALALALVAVPRQRPIVRLSDRTATVQFVQRDTQRLDAERTPTDLGTALVTTVEQTILDLAHRPGVGGMEGEAWEAVRALWPRASVDVLTALADGQRLKAALNRAKREAATGDA